MRDLVAQLMTAHGAGRGVACCRLVETRGSTPQKAGAAMLVFEDGAQAGTLGGGCVEAEVKRQALAMLGRGEAAVVRFQLDDDYGWDDGLICGGRMQILIDPLAAAVHGCGASPAPCTCRTSMPCSFSTSLISARWHCHHSASAHITAAGCAEASCTRPCHPSANSAVARWSA